MSPAKKVYVVRVKVNGSELPIIYFHEKKEMAELIADAYKRLLDWLKEEKIVKEYEVIVHKSTLLS